MSTKTHNPTQHFARITPIVGANLHTRRVALAGLPLGAPLVRYLAASGIGRWLWQCDAPTSASLRAELLAQHGAALALDAQALAPGAWHAAITRGAADLLVAVGAAADANALAAAHTAGIPALLIIPPSAATPCQAITILPGDAPLSIPHPPSPICLPPAWEWACAAPLCAGLARALLLRDTAYQRADLAALWAAGVRVFSFGAGGDPLEALAHHPPPGIGWGRGRTRTSADDWPVVGAHPPSSASIPLALPTFHTPAVPRGTLLIAGLGSLGSEAARLLVGHAAGMLLADPDRVDAYNPARQAYPVMSIGEPKAHALAAQLRAWGVPQVVAHPHALTDERAVAELIERHGITAALIATGTAADFAIARALRARGLPHVVGRCYLRARYWEAIVVDGARGPALSDMRGHVQPGPAPTPTPEQIAAYSDAGALEAEPATLIESGWAAAWLARIAAQLLAPQGLRERWLLELLAAERTCLIGGVGVEPTEDGVAYGIAAPGQVRAWGRAQVRGSHHHP